MSTGEDENDDAVEEDDEKEFWEHRLFSIAGGDGDADGVDNDNPGIPKAFELLSPRPAIIEDDEDDDDEQGDEQEHEDDEDDDDEAGGDNGGCGGSNCGDCADNGITSSDDICPRY